MRGVGEELSFAFIGLPDAFEQRVEGVSQASDLVILKIDAGGDLDLRDATELLAITPTAIALTELRAITPTLPEGLQRRIADFLQNSSSSGS